MKLLPVLFLLTTFVFSQVPAEYKLLKQFRDTKDVKVGLFLLNNYPDAVFKDELKVEVAKLLAESGDKDRARFILTGINLDNVRDEYGETVAKLWLSLGLEEKVLVLRFPEHAIELLPKVELNEQEREKVYSRLLSKGLYKEVLNISESCFYRGLSLFRLREYERSLGELTNCQDDRANVYALLVYIKLGDTKGAEELLRRAGREELYYKYAWHLLSKGDLKRARKFFLRSGYNFESLFRLGLIDFILGRYRLAYENFSEAQRFAAGNMERAQVSFWKYKVLNKLGERELGEYYLKESARYEGFYASVARKFLRLPVYEKGEFKLVGEPSTLGTRLLGIQSLGFNHYMRLEALNRVEELLPEDILEILKVDPYLALKIAARNYGANSPFYRGIAYPLPFRPLVQRISDKFAVKEALIYAVMRQESLFDTRALSKSNAKGLMQLLDTTARWKAERIGFVYDDIYDIETNITLGVAYLRYLLDFWNGDLVRAVASYNAGQGAVKSWQQYEDDFVFIETIPYDETRRYVKRVLWFYYVYSEKLSKEPF